MFNLPRNMYVVSLFMALSVSGASLMLIAGGLLATQIAPQPKFATLPMALMIISAAISTVPAGLIMRRYGRKAGMMLSVIVSIMASLLAAWAAIHANFLALLIAAVGIGFNQSFAHSGRFAILESALSAEQGASGLSLALFAGIISAIVGPQISFWGRDLIASDHGYAGSFVLFAVLQVGTLCLLHFFSNPIVASSDSYDGGRPLSRIIRQPVFIAAVGCAAFAFFVKTLVLTAVPIQMSDIKGFALESVKWVVQGHLMAMYLPAMVTGMLLIRIAKKQLLLIGFFIYMLVSTVAMMGHQFSYYMLSMLLLGVGWNLLFLTGTAMLPRAYRPEERFKTQACNDFIVLGSEATASFIAGWLLYSIGWSGIMSVVLSGTLLATGVLLWIWMKKDHFMQTG